MNKKIEYYKDWNKVTKDQNNKKLRYLIKKWVLNA